MGRAVVAGTLALLVFVKPPRQETSKRVWHPQLPGSGEVKCPSSSGMPQSLQKKKKNPLLINLRLKL